MRFLLYTLVGLFLILTGLFVADKIMADDYHNCSASFSTDKEFYYPGDTIKLTLAITTGKTKEKINLYDNFDNLEFSSHFTRTCYPDKPEVGDCAFETMIDQKSLPQKESVYRSYQISADKPFEKTFTGTVSFDISLKTYTISFPELGYKASFTKAEYNNSKSYGFVAYLKNIRPAFGVSDDYLFVQYKSIKLKV